MQLNAKDLRLANTYRDHALAERIARVDRLSGKWALVDLHRRGYILALNVDSLPE